jgi:alkylhydroperoxidase family enzyme
MSEPLTKGFLVYNHLFSSTLSDRVREMVTVRVCWLRRGEYEWAQHVRMARAAGMSEEEIEAISAGPGSPSDVSDRSHRGKSGRSAVEFTVHRETRSLSSSIGGDQ